MAIFALETVDTRQLLEVEDGRVLTVELDEIPCSQKLSGDGGTPQSGVHQLGGAAGWVNIDFDMSPFGTAQDRLDVFYDGELVASTGVPADAGTLSFYYEALPGRPTTCSLRVVVGPTGATPWEYTVQCPSGTRRGDSFPNGQPS